jgi:hypothetical protein
MWKILRSTILLGAVICLLVSCNPLAEKKGAEPLPGAKISAVIDMGRAASSGSLSFQVSDAGISITDLRIALEDANCDDMISMGSVEDYQKDPSLSIINGTFQGSLPAMGGMVQDYEFTPGATLPTPVPDPYNVGHISGRFDTPNTASGKITIYLAAPMSSGIVCDLGTFDWGPEK